MYSKSIFRFLLAGTFTCVFTQLSTAQNVGIGLAAPQARLHINGSARIDGPLFVRPVATFPAAAAIAINTALSSTTITAVAGTQANSVTYTATPQEGQLLYILNEDADPATFAGTTIPATQAAGFVYLAAGWRAVGGGTSLGWLLAGNAGTTPATNFLGTTDAQPLVIRTNNVPRLQVLTDGRLEQYITGNNVAIGENAGVLYAAGSTNNVAIGEGAAQNGGGLNSVVIGTEAGYNTAEEGNVIIGYRANYDRQTSNPNHVVIVGNTAGYNYGEAAGGVMIGSRAGYNHIEGSGATFMGYEAGYNNNTGNNEGSYNTLIGYQSGRENIDGDSLTFLGTGAGQANILGDANTYIGAFAGVNRSNNLNRHNTFVGAGVSPNGVDVGNTFVGYRVNYGQTGGVGPGWSVAVGSEAAYTLSEMAGAVMIGRQAGYHHVEGSAATFVGFLAGYNNNTGNSGGDNNTFVGFQAGFTNDFGSRLTALGVQAGYGSKVGSQNIYVGYAAGFNHFQGSVNIVIGDSASYNGGESERNMMIGHAAGYTLFDGTDNVLLGHSAGYRLGNGGVPNAQQNVFVGNRAGYQHTYSNRNTFVGHEAGFAAYTNSTIPSDNVALGYRAGYNLSSGGGFRNVLIGALADVSDADVGYSVMIGYDTKTDIGSPAAMAIGPYAFANGGFDIILGGEGHPVDLPTPAWELGLRTNSPIYPLHLNATEAAKLGTNTWTVISDARLKHNITPYTDGVAQLMQIRPVWFQYRDTLGIARDSVPHVGVLAQELQQVAPYMVTEVSTQNDDNSTILNVDNGAMTYMLVNAVQQQQQEIATLRAQLQQLQQLQTEVAALKQLMLQQSQR
jgi:trimeric autotransporter adhesin